MQRFTRGGVSYKQHQNSVFPHTNEKAFTLTETIIILTVLGIIAAITVPGLVNNSNEKQNITKVRKAVTLYEDIVEQMRITNNLTSVEGSTETSLNGYAKGNDYKNGKSYFKIKKEDDNTKYLFKTNDNIWWNIKDMSNPIISLNDDCKNSTPSTIKTDACYNKSFYLTTELNTAAGNAFIINNPESNAKYTLYYAGIGNLSGFDKCKADGSKKCMVNGINYNLKNLDKSVSFSWNSTWWTACKDFYASKTTSCTKKIENEELYFSNFISQNTDEFQSTEGKDNWEKANNYCKSKGARLPNAVEIKAYCTSGNYCGYPGLWSSDTLVHNENAYSALYWSSTWHEVTGTFNGGSLPTSEFVCVN